MAPPTPPLKKKKTKTNTWLLSPFHLICSIQQEVGGSDELPLQREFPLLRQHSVSSLKQLMPFFETLNYAFKAQGQLPADGPGRPASSLRVLASPKALQQLEECVELDFLEHLEC